MIIFVKTLSGKTITLDVADTDTIETVKKKVEERESVPVATQRIVFAGKDLDDNKTLAECAIKKESIVHLVLKASEKNLQMYTDTQKKELHVAQTKTSKYYNESAGLQDELSTYKDSETKFDTHTNPEGSNYDLGKDGEFKEFVVLIGYFVPVSMGSPIAALQKKGFKVLQTTNEKDFIQNLPNVDIAWILSGTDPNTHQAESYPAYKTVTKKEFAEAVVKFHQAGGGLFIWGDNAPLFEHANAVLPSILKSEVQLIGNTLANKKLVLGDGNKTGQFSPHIVFTGVISLYEGVTICYPETLGPLKVLATSTDGHPAICFADNEALQDNAVGRVMLDCGYTKNYSSWDTAGSARYVINATIWLLGLEHKILHEMPIDGKNKDGKHESTLVASNYNNNNYRTHSPRSSTTTTTTTSYPSSSSSSSSSSPTSPTPQNKKPWWRFGR